MRIFLRISSLEIIIEFSCSFAHVVFPDAETPTHIVAFIIILSIKVVAEAGFGPAISGYEPDALDRAGLLRNICV